MRFTTALLTGMTLGQSASGCASTDGWNLPEPSAKVKTMAFWATWYNLPVVEQVADGFPLLSMLGRSLGVRLSKRDWCSAAMEGSVAVRGADGTTTTYNYEGSADVRQVDCTEYFKHEVGKTRFRKARGEFGDGVGDYILVPFRSIAVDPDVIPKGSVVFVPQARGLQITLPDGTQTRHDGYFFAADVGGLIKDNHIDVYLGPSQENPFAWVTSNPQTGFEGWIVEQSQISAELKRLHSQISSRTD